MNIAEFIRLIKAATDILDIAVKSIPFDCIESEEVKAAIEYLDGIIEKQNG